MTDTRAPTDPIAAVTHPDPYPYYAALRARAPLGRDPALGMWVAAGAGAVTAVLQSDLCRVRPPAEPVPAALAASPAGDVFARLVRMTDGPPHARVKPAVAVALDGLDVAALTERAGQLARTLGATLAPERAGDGLRDFALRLPVYVVAHVLGVGDAELAEAARWTEAFATGLAPGAASEATERAANAAGALRGMFRSRLGGRARDRTGPFGALAAAGGRAGIDDDVVVANAIGLLFQSHEATAALIAGTLAALGARPELSARVAADPQALLAVVREVARWDAPVQNTRRFVARSGVVAEVSMKEGDVILVVLAAANRDPAANADPDRFDLQRSPRVAFTFGVGPHACPGEAIATAIATAGVRELLRAGLDPVRLGPPSNYRRSVNVRMPLWRAS
jgi:cytochrome P450